MEEFPTIGKYNKAIKEKGSGVFRSLTNLEIIPSRISPIKVFLFGSGAYAAVFKGRQDNSTYALRCFLNSGEEAADRLEMITSYLKRINARWITPCDFMANEIQIEGRYYPVLKMEWIDGVLLNDFISKHLSNNQVLTDLQKQLLEISKSLEENNIGHGDLQCGNIMVSGITNNFIIRLIDYDGMYTPYLINQKSLENGRSEFQHPDRAYGPFNHKIDRFSFWVILTALEALKYDKTLWREVMQGGYNTLDNMLFKAADFKNPHQSPLFARLYQINQESLNFYLNNLKNLSNGGITNVIPPELFATPNGFKIPESHRKFVPNLPPDPGTITSNFQILANEEAVVLSSTFQKLGNTPLLLEKAKFNGKTVVVSNGTKTRQVLLSSHKDVIELTFT